MLLLLLLFDDFDWRIAAVEPIVIVNSSVLICCLSPFVIKGSVLEERDVLSGMWLREP